MNCPSNNRFKVHHHANQGSRQVERIIATATKASPTPIGALTSDNRDVWTSAREKLIAASPDGLNAQSLEDIESALIIVCLDDTKPVTREQISWACWTGDGRNRFYDKHQRQSRQWVRSGVIAHYLLVLVFDNGRSGFLGEHSCMDGTPTLRMNEFIMASTMLNKIDPGTPHSAETAAKLPEPVELKFKVNDEVQALVKKSEEAFDELVGKHDLHVNFLTGSHTPGQTLISVQVLHFEGYGKNYIKKFKASPDAWAQLVKQLAFHKMFNRPGVTYESAQTRKFQLGRTEVIRAASNETKKWAEAMLDPNQTVGPLRALCWHFDD